MELVLKSSLETQEELVLNEINIEDGSGEFLIEGGFKKDKTITVHYYKPTKLTEESSVILVIPGAGRNGNDYRDAWIEKAEEYNILVLSPEYSEKNYPEFWSYNLAGMISNVQINEDRTAVTSFDISKNPNKWIYNDFDRIFDLAREKTDLNTNKYDLFGHSAGGQILHRLAIFKPTSKANRILASNSGWYTVPDDSVDFPYGLKNSSINSEKVNFENKLILFLGEKDDENETRGDVRHTPEADEQGLHRLERGKYFFKRSKIIAEQQNADFRWNLHIVPNIGHDYKGMSKAGADFLYKPEE